MQISTVVNIFEYRLHNNNEAHLIELLIFFTLPALQSYDLYNE